MKKQLLVSGLVVAFLGGLLLAGNASAEDAGKELFVKHCKRCHGDDGSGKKDGQPLGVVKVLKLDDPELLDLMRDDAKKVAADDKEFANLINNGKKKMKAMNTKVKPEEIPLVQAYVKQLQGSK